MTEYESTQLPSRFQIGEHVLFRIYGGENDGVSIGCYIRAVLFSSGKVRYSLLILDVDPPNCKAVSAGLGTTIHNVDSALLDEHPDGGEIELERDNYS